MRVCEGVCLTGSKGSSGQRKDQGRESSIVSLGGINGYECLSMSVVLE